MKGEELAYLVILLCFDPFQFLCILVGVVSAGAGVTDCANLNSPGETLFWKVFLISYFSSILCKSEELPELDKEACC